ncbi:hypothetical protein V490_09386 [Pseudogymnoascus sp. VKM F-3557]|nr:hypothetical protein V490_09386 [Pseudogymnoascus sp. VKM F-3557]
MASSTARILRGSMNFVPPTLSSLSSEQQGLVLSPDTTRQVSSSSPADPERIFATPSSPQAPDVRPGSSLATPDHALHEQSNTRTENAYDPIGAARTAEPAIDNASNSQSAVHATGHEALAPQSFATEQDTSSLRSYQDRNAIAIDFGDDDEYIPNVSEGGGENPPPASNGDGQNSPAASNGDGQNSPTASNGDGENPPTDSNGDDEHFPHRRPYSDYSAIHPSFATALEFQPMEASPVLNPMNQEIDSIPSASMQLNPTAPAFEYQPSHDGAATGADQRDLHPQASGAPVVATRLPIEASSAPVSEPQTPKVKLREKPFHPDKIRKIQKRQAAEEALNRGLANDGVAQNEIEAAQSQESQNDTVSHTPSMGPCERARSNESWPTTGSSGGQSDSGYFTTPGTSNGSPERSIAFNSLAEDSAAGPSSSAPRSGSDRPEFIAAGPYRPPYTWVTPTRASDAELPIPPTPVSGQPYEIEATAGPSNSIAFLDAPESSRTPRAPNASIVAVRTNTQAASPPREPPSPTTGTAGASVLATRRGRGRAEFRTWRQSPPTPSSRDSTSAAESSTAASQSPTDAATHTSACSGTAGVSLLTEGSSAQVEPAGLGDQESTSPAQPPTPQPTQMSANQGAANSGPSNMGSRAPAMRTGSNWHYGRYRAQRGHGRRAGAAGSRWGRGGWGFGNLAVWMASDWLHGNDPCETCIKLRQTMEYQLESKTQRFSECIRTRIKDINIFGSNFNSTDNLSHPLHLIQFGSQLKWIMGDLDATSAISQDNLTPPNVDRQIHDMFFQGFVPRAKDIIPPEIIKDFHTMVLSFAILSSHTSTTEDSELKRAIRQAGIRTGQRLLERLDQLLSSLHNGKVSTTVPIADVAKAHFILLYGTLLAVYYARDPGSSQSFNILDSETGSYRPSTLWNAMREHLYSMLAHHLVFLVSRLDLALPSFERPMSLQDSKLPEISPPFFVIFGTNQDKAAANETTKTQDIFCWTVSAGNK